MLLFGLILWLHSTSACQTTSNYLEETSECAKIARQFEFKIQRLFFGNCYTFKEFITRNHAFVDKSLLLREVFKDYTYLTIFYLPSNFGKTMNLDMLRTFTETEVDSNHSILARNQTFAYNYFALGKILNENGTVEDQLQNPPLISRHMDLIDQHVAQHPAIYFNLYASRNIHFGLTWGALRDHIGDEFIRYRFLTSRISANESSRFIQLVDYFNRTKFALKFEQSIDLLSAVIFLAETTTKFFQKKPILYIDEYDSMLSAVLHRNFLNDVEEERVWTFFNQFIETIFSREDIWHRIVVTGTHSVHSNIMSSLPGTKAIYHAFDNNLSHFFGFTETDVQIMSKHFHRLDEKQVQEMREYYNGYQMGHHYPIYNPACVMDFFTTKKLSKFWTDGIAYKSFTNNLWGVNQMRYLWLDLLSDRAKYMSRPFEKFSPDDLKSLQNVLRTGMKIGSFTKQSVSFSSKEFTQALMYQVDMGYLTLANYVRQDREITFHVRAPNLAIRKAVFDHMRISSKGYRGLNIELADKAIVALHSYLFSRKREQFFDTLTQSFGSLFNQNEKLFEENANSIENPQVGSIGRRIIEYIGLGLEYRCDHKLDRNIADGFVATKLNVSSVVIFNFNQSVANEDILNQIDNYTHPWIQLGPQPTNSSVTYLVIGVGNGTEICTRRYGAEPPILTTKAPIVQTTKKKKGGKKSATIAGATRSKKTKKSKSGSKFQPKVTKPMNVSITNVSNVTSGHTSKFTTDLTTPQGSKSTSQSNLDIVNPLNQSSTIEEIARNVDSTTKSMEIRTQINKLDDHSENNSTTPGSTESSPADTTYFKSSSTEGISKQSKFSPSTIKSLEDSLTTQPMVTQVNRTKYTEARTSEPTKDHPGSTESKSTNTSSSGTIGQISSIISTSLESTQSSKFSPAATKSLNDTYVNKGKIVQTGNSATKGVDIQTISYGVKYVEDYTENCSFSTVSFAESSLKEITRVVRSIPTEQSSSTVITSEKSISEVTTLSNKSLKNETTITDSSKITTITSPQKSSPTLSMNKKLKSGLKSNPNDTKSLNESFTNEIKTTNSDTTANEKNTKITKVASVQQSQPTDTKGSTISTQINPSNSSKPKTRPSKSGSKSNPKGTRPYSNSTFSRKKKGKNFNATAFVRGNSTKFTKFARGSKSFPNRTVTTSTSTTTQSTTPEITVDTYFPTFRRTRPRIMRRSRTGSKLSPKSTTISRIKFLKLFFNVRG